jgi:hypothetical protein
VCVIPLIASAANGKHNHLQVVIWFQLVPDALAPPVTGAGGETLCEVALDGESESLLSERGSKSEFDSGYDVAREMDALEAAVVNGRRAQVHALGCSTALM